MILLTKYIQAYCFTLEQFFQFQVPPLSLWFKSKSLFNVLSVLFGEGIRERPCTCIKLHITNAKVKKECLFLYTDKGFMMIRMMILYQKYLFLVSLFVFRYPFTSLTINTFYSLKLSIGFSILTQNKVYLVVYLSV